MADTNNYTLFQKVEKWTTKEKFNALGNLTEIATGTEYNLTGEIEESELASNLQTKINGKLTKPTNPSAESAVTMLADGTVGTKPLSEIGGGKLYLHKITMTVNYAASEGAIAVVRSQRQNAYTLEDLTNDIKGCTIARYHQGDNGIETSYLSLVYDTMYMGEPDYMLVLMAMGSNNTFDMNITNIVSDNVTEV